MFNNNNRLGIPGGRPLRGCPGSPPGYHPAIPVTIPVSEPPLLVSNIGSHRINSPQAPIVDRWACCDWGGNNVSPVSFQG